MKVDNPRRYLCQACGHMNFYHRESGEWQLLNSRRKRNLNGCTRVDVRENTCTCQHFVPWKEKA